jgi:hypothetical protein
MLVFAFFLSFLTIDTFAQWPTEYKLLPSDNGTNTSDSFGFSVSISENVCMVGDHPDSNWRGRAYIYRFNGDNWVEEQKLLAPDGTEHDSFGFSVSTDGNVCAVGANGDDPNGAVYIFRYNGTSWILEQKLTGIDGATDLGDKVAIKNDICLVSSSAALVGGVPKGAVYFYKYNGSSWQYVQKLIASDGAQYDYFGSALSLSGDLCVIGAAEDDPDGSAHIFRYDGNTWTKEAKLTETSYRFGDAVGISDGWKEMCIVGAPYDGEAASEAGAVHLYMNTGGGNWEHYEKFIAPDAAAGNHYGSSVFIADDSSFIAGSPYDDDLGTYSGSTYVYRLRTDVYCICWYLAKKLKASDGAVNDLFGFSVAGSGNNFLVGAKHFSRYIPGFGAAYVYDFTCPTADLTGDCYVDFKDFAAMAGQWLDGNKSQIP